MEALTKVAESGVQQITGCPLLKQTLSDPTTKCIICLETWANLEPQVIKLLPCNHLLWYDYTLLAAAA